MLGEASVLRGFHSPPLLLTLLPLLAMGQVVGGEVPQVVHPPGLGGRVARLGGWGAGLQDQASG